jgi:hypothetical protein
MGLHPSLGISVDALLDKENHSALPRTPEVHVIFKDIKPNVELQLACRKLCEEFPNLFKPELGTLKDVELEVKFKPSAQPVFRRPRPVPHALQEDLAQAYAAGIQKGVWRRTQFSDYGTPVVPVRKRAKPGQDKASLRVCGDYSTTVNPQLETHRYPMPSPEQLIQRLSGGCYFTKIDLADAYNQILLGPESQKRLALSTHQGVLLQQRLPFGITSAPGYFQEIMDQLTRDLPGVAVYMDDILVPVPSLPRVSCYQRESNHKNTTAWSRNVDIPGQTEAQRARAEIRDSWESQPTRTGICSVGCTSGCTTQPATTQDRAGSTGGRCT